MASNILICTVIYNQNLTDCNSYKTLLYNNQDVIIIDNSTIEIFDNRKTAQSNKWEYVHLPNNPGLSFAYNHAAKYACHNNYKWLLISDQDTLFDTNTIYEYSRICEKFDDIFLFCPRVIVKDKGLLSPVKLNHYFPKIANSTIKEDTIIKPSKYAIINSGMLINVNAFLSVGGYNERVFLDFSDFQFIEKFSQRFDKAYVANLVCQQDFSNDISDYRLKQKRFSLFCKSLKNFECRNALHKMLIHLVVIKRALSLILEFRNISPLNILIKEYIL